LQRDEVTGGGRFLARDAYLLPQLKLTDEYWWHPISYIRQYVNVVPQNIVWFMQNDYTEKLKPADWHAAKCAYSAEGGVFVIEKTP
jgi:hypothetical protein